LRLIRSLERPDYFPMKSFLPICLVAILVVAAPAGIYAKSKKGKGKGDQNGPAEGNPAIPAEALAPYINNLDALLALNRPATKSLQAFFAQSSGRIVTLRQEFIGEQANAPAENKHLFKAAIATCDAISGALAERDSTLADMQSSSAVANSGKLEQPSKKDNLTQGIKGGDFAKAVGSVVERDRERQATAIAKKNAAGGDHALTSMSANRWNKRSAELKQKIIADYSQIK
jgi:hypothetical protein